MTRTEPEGMQGVTTIITTTEETVCDRDHDDPVAAEVTRTLGVDGTDYEIDLCGPHAAELEDGLRWVVKYARPVRPQRARPQRARRQPKRYRSEAKRASDAEIRTWWRTHQDAVDRPYQDKGRMPADVIAAHEAAKGN
jgi:hypothetical protein